MAQLPGRSGETGTPEKIRRPRQVAKRMTPHELAHQWICAVGPRLGDTEPRHFQAEVPVRRGKGCVMLSLDSKRDKLAVIFENKMGCAGPSEVTWYYLHADGSGRKYFYKTGEDVPRKITDEMERKMLVYLRNLGPDTFDGTESEKIKRKMIMHLQDQALAERLCMFKIVTRGAVRRKLNYLESFTSVDIYNKELKREHGPRPTFRGFGGLPPQRYLEWDSVLEKEYWSRLRKREPIPPEVWQLLEEEQEYRRLRDRKHPAPDELQFLEFKERCPGHLYRSAVRDGSDKDGDLAAGWAPENSRTENLLSVD